MLTGSKSIFVAKMICQTIQTNLINHIKDI